MKKYLSLTLLFSILFVNAVYAQSSATPPYDYKRSDDASFEFTTVNKTPAYGAVDRFGRLFTADKPGLFACNTAATGTTAVTIIPAVAGKSHLVSRINCHNNSTVASILTINDNVTAKVTDIIGTTTLGTNRVVFEFPLPLKGTVNTVISVTPTTTATSTVCCANYVDISNP